MSYEIFDVIEANEGSEILEKGVLLERYNAPETDIMESAEPSELYGTPYEDASVWFKAKNICLDGLICEQYVSDLLTGTKLSEQELYIAANMPGFYDSEYGCTLYETGKYLENLDIQIIRENNLTVNDICQVLENGEKIICAISSIALHFPKIRNMPGLSADSFVQVVGVDMIDSNNKKIIINNPSEEQGAVEISFESFIEAWKKSECYAVIAGIGIKR